MKKPSVSIISVNFNQTEVTCQMLESVRRQDFQDIEVIVVDNCSKESCAATVRARFPEVRVIESSKNLGFAGGNNLAVREARGDYFFFVNNDTELPSGCLKKLVELAERTPGFGAASPKILYFPEENSKANNTIQYAGTTPVSPLTARNRTIGHGEPDHGQYAVATPTAYVHGAAMLVPRSVCEQAGLMDEDFFLYYEELDWAERIRRAGFSIWVEPTAEIFHKESLTVARMGALKTYYLNRNRVRFMHRNFGGWRLAAFHAFLFAVTVPKNLLSFYLKGERENARAFWQGVMWNFRSERPAATANQFEKIRLAIA